MSNAMLDAKNKPAMTYEVFTGVHISLEDGAAEDYAEMKFAQLSAILELKRLALDCPHTSIDKATDSAFIGLAISITSELKHLFQITDFQPH